MSDIALVKPGVKFDAETRERLQAAGIGDDEVRVLEVFRHVHFGHMTVYKRAGKLEGRIEFRETY